MQPTPPRSFAAWRGAVARRAVTRWLVPTFPVPRAGGGASAGVASRRLGGFTLGLAALAAGRAGLSRSVLGLDGNEQQGIVTRPAARPARPALKNVRRFGRRSQGPAGRGGAAAAGPCSRARGCGVTLSPGPATRYAGYAGYAPRTQEGGCAQARRQWQGDGATASGPTEAAGMKLARRASSSSQTGCVPTTVIAVHQDAAPGRRRGPPPSHLTFRHRALGEDLGTLLSKTRRIYNGFPSGLADF